MLQGKDCSTNITTRHVADKKEIRKEYEALFYLDKFSSNQIIEKSPTASLLFETIVNRLLKNKGMMIIMVTLTKGNQCQERIISS